jgi:hypothetical protein
MNDLACDDEPKTGGNRVGRWSRVKMSALGHKRTFAPQNAMSALPPKADLKDATSIARSARQLRGLPCPTSRAGPAVTHQPDPFLQTSRISRRSWLVSSMVLLPSTRSAPKFISASAECEAKSLHARIKKLDFKLAIGNWTGLPDQLVQTLFDHRADALFVNIKSVRRAWRLSIDQHTKFYGRSARDGEAAFSFS